MTVQQHAPRLERVGPPRIAVSNAVLIAIGALIIVALVAVGVWALVQPAAIPISTGELEALRNLELLRSMVGFGGFI
jgi:hypothetical protein